MVERYSARVLRFCERNKIVVPAGFHRHPASRWVVVRTDESPPKLSATCYFRKEDLHGYLRSKCEEYGLESGEKLPVRVLDFKDAVELKVSAQCRTKPGQPFDPEGASFFDSSGAGN